jgi:hypothetical protein
MKLTTLRTWQLPSSARNCRAALVSTRPGPTDAILVVHSDSVGCNPWIEMFSFPTDTLKLTLLGLDGSIRWTRDLGPGVMPDTSFCPVLSFDHDGDGVDEIYFVNNIDPEHPLAISKYRLERADSRTGETLGQWPWPGHNAEAEMNDAFRNAILGGQVGSEKVLVTTQGIYTSLYLQAWNPDMSLRWEVRIPQGSCGARGSHMYPVVDLNDDGVDELLWGERCLSLDTGEELFCGDRDTYSGHSDTILPFRDSKSGRWLIYTAREKQSKVSPRVAVYDTQGRRVWGAIDAGHMHINWIARFGHDAYTAIAIRIGSQEQTRQSRNINGREPFAFDASTGEVRELPFDPFQFVPVDLNGDGLHELVRGTAHNGGGDGAVIDGQGRPLGTIEGGVAMAGKIIDHPGEQVLTYSGRTIRLWGDAAAKDVSADRYQHRYYQQILRSTATGNQNYLLAGV